MKLFTPENSGRDNILQQANRPQMIPIKRLRLGVWESTLHLEDQIFLLVLPDEPRKLVFISVQPSREMTSSTLNQQLFIQNIEFNSIWQKNKKRIL